MDIRDLFLSCRLGDLKKIKYLVEHKEVNLNVRDRWDSTPLYYACLCGHTELVEYLLENGARCEAQTFDGERILYGALTNEIRNKLRTYKVTTSRLVARDDFEEFLRKLLDIGDYTDFAFKLHGETFSLHRFILSARSPYFFQAFQNKWKSKRTVKLQNTLVDPSALKSVLQFLYTGRFNSLIDEVDECVRIANQCRLPDLSDRLQEANKRITSFAETKPGTRIKVLSLESTEMQSDLQRELGLLAETAIPVELLPSGQPRINQFLNLIDVCFVVEQHRFHCHKAAFAGRSEYFRALFRDHFDERTVHFDESTDVTKVDVLVLRDVTALVFAQVVFYVYSNRVNLSADTVYDLLNVGEAYLMPGLKKLCANFLIGLIDCENVVDLIVMSRTYNLPRVEAFCYEFIARNIIEIVDLEEFHQLIIEDAAEVKGRQETDTIATIDDVRYHINLIHQSSAEALEKHRLIDHLLEKLNLEA